MVDQIPNLSNQEVTLRPAMNRPGVWHLLGVVDYQVGEVMITVPKDYVTDLASVPRALWAIFPPFGRYTAAAVVHDYLYNEQHVDGVRITRKWSDDVFLLAMKDLNVGWWRRTAMYSGVRAGGWVPWRRVRKQLEENGR